MTIKVINSKRQESNVEIIIAGMGGTKLRILSEWKAGTCPKGL
ncbi:MAG: tRNA A22 N-methylase [Oceanicoccus sp.]|jgi:tRNA A22 N-methylase